MIDNSPRTDVILGTILFLGNKQTHLSISESFRS